jgi:hypothetical protein
MYDITGKQSYNTFLYRFRAGQVELFSPFAALLVLTQSSAVRIRDP